MNKFTNYEFFAGGGMARAGLGEQWECIFANDFDPKKALIYAQNWGNGTLVCDDINNVVPGILSQNADLSWASFPCQDLSLAGKAKGLGTQYAQTRSGAFWGFWSLMKGLINAGCGPKMIVLENVFGSLTSNNSQDFGVICRCLAESNYKFGAIVLDASHFVSQSRPRVFFIALRPDIGLPKELVAKEPNRQWHPISMERAFLKLTDNVQKNWLWICPPAPTNRATPLSEVISDQVDDVRWHTDEETKKLLAMMSPLHLSKVQDMQNAGQRQVGMIYKRTRPAKNGLKQQRAELRTDGKAGCLRTPGGGSSRQLVLIVDGQVVRSRLISKREAARLMGLPDTYILPRSYNDAYHVIGDGVVVPVVRYIADTILEPTLQNWRSMNLAKAA